MTITEQEVWHLWLRLCGGWASPLVPTAALQVPVLPGDAGSFHCSLPRLMPLTAIDPSLAIGFFCANMSELLKRELLLLLFGWLVGLIDLRSGARLLSVVAADKQLTVCAVSYLHRAAACVDDGQ